MDNGYDETPLGYTSVYTISQVTTSAGLTGLIRTSSHNFTSLVVI